jgi:putative NADPH-quinone reductase
MDLIVFAHPREDSLCGCALRMMAAGRTAAPVVVDLYRDGFSPVLGKDELAAYGQVPDDPLLVKYQRQLAEATTATFVFPVWMYGLPAILKGYFDRVWTPGATFAFGVEGPAGLLKLSRVNVACTFGQPQANYDRMGDPVLTFFKRLVSQNCGADCAIVYEPLFGTDRIDAASVDAYLARVSDSCR